MDEHVAKIVTDLSFGTGCWPCGQASGMREERTHEIGGHGRIQFPLNAQKFQQKTHSPASAAQSRQRRERI